MVAVLRKELNDLRRSGNVVTAMVVLPLVFLIQPIIQVFAVPSSGSAALHHTHVDLSPRHPGTRALGVVGLLDRRGAHAGDAGTTPVHPGPGAGAHPREGTRSVRALRLCRLCRLRPFIAIVELFAAPGVAPALVQGPDVLAQFVFTPLLVILSIWIGMAISARSRDSARRPAVHRGQPAHGGHHVAHRLQRDPATFQVALDCGVGLLLLDRLGWRIATSLFDRERLITSVK